MSSAELRRAARARTWSYANRVVSGLTIIGFASACFVVWQQGAREPLAYLVSVIPAAQAAAGMLLLVFIAPGVYAGWRLFPVHFLSLPLIYAALAWSARFLTRQTPDGIQLVGQVPRFDAIWENPSFLGFVVVWSACLLALAGMLKSSGPADKPAPPVQ